RDILKPPATDILIQRRSVLGEMGFEDIQAAVCIEVADSNTHAGLLAAIVVYGQASLQPLFGERAVAPVVEQQAGGGVAGHVDLLPAIAIQVARNGAQTETWRSGAYAGAVSHLGEGAVPVVVVEKRAFWYQ